MKILFLLQICIILAFTVKGQIIYNEEGEQVPFTLTDKYQNLIDLAKIKTCTLKSYNNDSLYAKYNNNSKEGGNIQAGIPIDTLINLKTYGTKCKIAEGTLWLYKIESKTAEMLNVELNIPDMPEGAYICIFPKKEQLYMKGPRFFFKEDIIKQGIHQYQYGNQLYIEYFEPNGSVGSNNITIKKIAYIFTTPFKNKKSEQNKLKLKSGIFGSAVNGCQYNVVCPEVNSWSKESRSVVYIFVGYWNANGIYTFTGGTGFFINKSNNYADNDQPYILSAGHLLGGWSQVNGVWTFTDLSNQLHDYEFRVNYRDENCTDLELRTGQLLSGSFSVIQKGNSYNKRASSDPNYEENEDYALLQISQPFSSLKKYNILYAGWTSTPQYYLSGYGAIGHPHNDVQKVLVENNGGTIPLSGKYVSFFFDKGVAESGFSGSPVFNSSKKLVGWICTLPSLGSCSNVGLNIDATLCGRFDRLYFNIASYIDPTNLNQANDSEPTPPPAPTLPSHCNNCIQDYDETGLDCGGSCLPCGMKDVLTLKTQADIIKNNISARYELSTEPDAGYRFEYISGSFNLNAGHSVHFKNNVLIKEGVTLKAAAIPELMSEPPRGCQSTCISAANVFTPNADGVNDYWIFSQAFVKDYNLIVKNRYGNNVYTKPNTPISENGIVRGWDGTGISANGTYYIWMTYTDCFGTTRTNQYTVSVFGLKSASLNESQDGLTGNDINIEDGAFKIIAYPNPTGGKVSVETYNCDLMFDYILTDATGKILNQDFNISGTGEIDLTPYPSGLYLLRVKTGENIQLCKLIKK